MSFFRLNLFVVLVLLSTNGFAKTLSLVVSDGEKVGAYKEIVDFVARAVRDAGFEVNIVELPRKRGASAVDKGEFDAVAIRSFLNPAELPNLVATSYPVAFTTYRVVSLATDSKFSEGSLKNFSGAMVLNSPSLQPEVKKRSLQVNEINSGYADLMKMLKTKRVDYIILPEEVIASCLDQDKTLGKTLKVSSEVFLRTPLYFLINQKHRDLMPKIEKSLRKALNGDLSQYKYIKNSLNRSGENPNNIAK